MYSFENFLLRTFSSAIGQCSLYLNCLVSIYGTGTVPKPHHLSEVPEWGRVSSLSHTLGRPSLESESGTMLSNLVKITSLSLPESSPIYTLLNLLTTLHFTLQSVLIWVTNSMVTLRARKGAVGLKETPRFQENQDSGSSLIQQGPGPPGSSPPSLMASSLEGLGYVF